MRVGGNSRWVPLLIPVQPSFVNCTRKFSNVFAKEFNTM